MNYVFDLEKKYKLTINLKGEDLTFTAKQVRTIETLITFTDKFGQQYVFPLEALQQATEVKE